MNAKIVRFSENVRPACHSLSALLAEPDDLGGHFLSSSWKMPLKAEGDITFSFASSVTGPISMPRRCTGLSCFG